MLLVSAGNRERPLRRVLAIGAHSDDLEIGCGGTVLRLLRDYPDLEIVWLVLSAHGDRRDEARASAEALVSNAAKSEILIDSFRDGFLPYDGAAVKERFEQLKAQFDPDLILTHYGRDAHQDHRLVSELTWNTYRNHMVLEFEIPKYDGDLGAPNFFVRLEHAVVSQKIDHLLRHFTSQRERHWFTEDLFRSLMRIRGMECNAPDGYAEAFYSRKTVL
jgi:LmbE family N-acetylglucosaminyl deacetylase